MLLGLFLLPLVAAVAVKPANKNYVLDIEDGTLKNVQLEGDKIAELDLSGMELRGLEKNAFDNLADLKSLNLANNSLESLPEFVFSNLTNLEYLCLSENKLSALQYLFVGLENLKLLNISYNPVLHLRRGNLFGLSKSVKILAEGNKFWSISTGVFENAFLKDKDDQILAEKTIKDHSKENRDENPTGLSFEQPEIGTADPPKDINPGKQLKKDQKVKLCMCDNVVTSLDLYEKEESLANGCSVLPVDEREKKLSLHGLGIKGFQEGWYKLQSLPIATLDLSNNEISEITKETLNYLPADLAYVNLASNRIRRIWNQIIENEHLKRLNLKDNLLEDIEEGAFQKTKLTGLYFLNNLLENLKFMPSLPGTLTDMILAENQITSIPNEAFSNLPSLIYLNLSANKIGKLQNNVFKGLKSLQVLSLTKNQLSKIEPEAFKGLKELTTLHLYQNSLSDFEKGTFADLENLTDINLAFNKFTKITKNTFADLPKSLDFLRLEYNEISSLEEGSFVGVPRFTLSLFANKISSIPRGAFNLPMLGDLHLNNNSLTTIDGDSFDGLPQLKRLWLSENKISEIHKGACKNLGSLHVLDISLNPFEKLENGALYGISKAKGTFLDIYNNHLKELEGGVFDDV